MTRVVSCGPHSCAGPVAPGKPDPPAPRPAAGPPAVAPDPAAPARPAAGGAAAVAGREPGASELLANGHAKASRRHQPGAALPGCRCEPEDARDRFWLRHVELELGPDRPAVADRLETEHDVRSELRFHRPAARDVRGEAEPPVRLERPADILPLADHREDAGAGHRGIEPGRRMRIKFGHPASLPDKAADANAIRERVALCGHLPVNAVTSISTV